MAPAPRSGTRHTEMIGQRRYPQTRTPFFSNMLTSILSWLPIEVCHCELDWHPRKTAGGYSEPSSSHGCRGCRTEGGYAPGPEADICPTGLATRSIVPMMYLPFDVRGSSGSPGRQCPGVGPAFRSAGTHARLTSEHARSAIGRDNPRRDDEGGLAVPVSSKRMMCQ